MKGANKVSPYIRNVYTYVRMSNLNSTTKVVLLALLVSAAIYAYYHLGKKRKEGFLYEEDPGLTPVGRNFYADPLHESSTRNRIREDRSGYGSIYDDSIDPDRIGVGFPVYGPY
jgi:hypothetical protein